jgi:ubiquinone/menaquinone biosynthesis C-methylase UbiE
MGLSIYRDCWKAETVEDAKKKVLFRLKSRVFRRGFEKDFEESGKREAEIVSNLVDKDTVVLDLGCGVGRVAKHLAPFVRELHGVDVSENMIGYAKENCRRVQNVDFKVNNGKDLSLYPNEAFDFVYSLLMLQHLEKQDALAYVIEVYRILKEGGRALLQFPNRSSFVYWVCHIYNLVNRKSSRMRLYSRKEAKSMLEEIGFKDIQEINLAQNEINLLAKK